MSADVENDTVSQITFFEVGEKDIRTILKIADFPEEPAIEEALSFDGDLDEPKKVPRSF
ncbi:hypothetical protein [Carnobacterium sp. FSL W8-0810]|uniref:hypothetical protein n=1 Tax=Carnobacterium sp. FSL W8-0810 TaxID=2954705 RepID=UPI0030F7A613